MTLPLISSNNMFFRFDTSNEQEVSILFLDSFKLQTYLSHSKYMSTKNFHELVHLSGENLHKTTEFDSFKTISVVENFLKH